MQNNIRIGKIGEDITCEYILRKGWKILKRNYRRKSDELDIIARSSDGILVFCEVKSLTGSISGLIPEDNLTTEKFRRISRTCEFFARQHPELIDEDKGWRIDLVTVDVGPDGKALEIRHHENI